MTTKQRVAAVLLAAAANVWAVPVSAQVTTGTIVGTVKDSAGAVVPGASVTVTETGKQTSSTYATDADGTYTAPFLIPGTYEIAVDHQGFRQYLRRGVWLHANLLARVDIPLEAVSIADS